jgi:SAM-dependent methyltransferase
MVFDYLHPIKQLGIDLYTEQLIKWLIEKNYLPNNKSIKILDLASGRGYFYNALKKLGYENTVATDLCPEFKECIQGDLTKKLPFKEESFDLIISRDIAEHISPSSLFFNEQFRLLKKGGRIIVMTPNAKSLTLGEFFDDYTHITPYTPKSLYEALKMHGFHEVKVSRLRAIPKLWKYTTKAFNFLYSKKKNNLLGIAVK